MTSHQNNNFSFSLPSCSTDKRSMLYVKISTHIIHNKYFLTNVKFCSFVHFLQAVITVFRQLPEQRTTIVNIVNTAMATTRSLNFNKSTTTCRNKDVEDSHKTGHQVDWPTCQSHKTGHQVDWPTDRFESCNQHSITQPSSVQPDCAERVRQDHRCVDRTFTQLDFKTCVGDVHT